jgi:hypothetical protein
MIGACRAGKGEKMTSATAKKTMAALCAAASMTLAPMVVAPAAQAEVCGGVGGRHVEVGGCTHVVGDVAAGVALAHDDDWAAQEAAGQPPCLTPSGVPYYTPGSDPCYP